MKALRAKRASAGTDRADKDNKAKERKIKLKKENDKAGEKVRRDKAKIDAKEFMRIHKHQITSVASSNSHERFSKPIEEWAENTEAKFS